MADKFKVKATGLNLRTEPRVAASTRIATLGHGQLVTKLGVADDPVWWKVSTVVDGIALTGFIHSDHVIPAEDLPEQPAANTVKEVHLQPTGEIRRDSKNGRAFPLNEPGQARRTSAAVSDKVAELGQIINWLNVEQSARYTPTTTSTYCNIYAYDYCFLSGVYLPRVWWKSKAIANLIAGEEVIPKYDVTVDELNANSLHDWLRDFGGDFGWRRTFRLDELQAAVNAGEVGIICAKRKDLNRSGHICAVVPETATKKANRSGGSISAPLQSQAGASNQNYFARVWWMNTKFQSHGFWIHA